MLLKEGVQQIRRCSDAWHTDACERAEDETATRALFSGRAHTEISALCSSRASAAAADNPREAAAARRTENTRYTRRATTWPPAPGCAGTQRFGHGGRYPRAVRARPTPCASRARDRKS